MEKKCYSISKIIAVHFKKDFTNIPEKILKEAQERGSYLHSCLDNLLRIGNDNNTQYPEHWKQTINLISNFKSINHIDSEHLFTNEKDQMISKYDFKLELDGKTTLIEFKTNSTINIPEFVFQLVCYTYNYYIEYGTWIDGKVFWVNKNTYQILSYDKDLLKVIWEQTISNQVKKAIEILDNINDLGKLID